MLSIKKTKIFFFGFLFYMLLFLAPADVLAQDTGTNSALGGLNSTATNAGLVTATTETDLATIIGKVVGVALSFLGVIFFILIIYGGYMWMFSMGNEQTVTKAKQVVISAVIGLIIVLMAYAVTAYLGGQFTAVS